MSASICNPDGAVCTVDLPCDLAPESELEQCQVLASCTDVQHEFETLWAARWGKHANPAECDWTRICQFARAFLPRGRLEMAPISYEQWRTALKRYKPRAARGPDGFSRKDLLRMPRERTQELLDFLNSIERGHSGWPEQLLTGLVLAHEKLMAFSHTGPSACSVSYIGRGPAYALDRVSTSYEA